MVSQERTKLQQTKNEEILLPKTCGHLSNLGAVSLSNRQRVEILFHSSEEGNRRVRPLATGCEPRRVHHATHLECDERQRIVGNLRLLLLLLLLPPFGSSELRNHFAEQEQVLDEIRAVHATLDQRRRERRQAV